MDFERSYRCFVLLGDPGCAPIWEWKRWLLVAKALDPLIRLARERGLVRVAQFFKNSRYKLVPFGRVAWTGRHHQKWTHNSPATGESSKEWDFYFVEISAPSYSKSHRDGQPPDVFVTITNEQLIKPDSRLLFNPVLFLAVADELTQRAPGVVEAVVQPLSEIVQPVLATAIQRSWGIRFGDFSWIEGIDSISHTSLFNGGNRHDRDLDEFLFRESWQLFDPGTFGEG